MPTKRRSILRGRATGLASLTGREQAALLHGWSPGELTVRWESWAAFLADYLAVRDELRRSLRATVRMARFGREPFAEEVYRRWGAAGPPAAWRCPPWLYRAAPELWGAHWTGPATWPAAPPDPRLLLATPTLRGH